MPEPTSSGGGGPVATIIVGLAIIAAAWAVILFADPNRADTTTTPAETASSSAGATGLVPLPLVLPDPNPAGTPAIPPTGVRIDMERLGKTREPFHAPPDAVNLALNATVTSSDMNPIVGTFDLVNNDDKDPYEGRYVELAPGKQHITLDLGAAHAIYAIALWHNHGDPRVYRDVVVQLSDDPDFTNAAIVFNNDHDNSSGFGVGQNFEYFESSEGELIAVTERRPDHLAMTRPLGSGRYVRLWSNGSTVDDLNHYAEVEIWGRAAD